jgi:hypothetical protein
MPKAYTRKPAPQRLYRRMPITRAATLAMSEENEEASQPRASRFREHTNTNNSIRPPPDELWKDIGIEALIEQYNEENAEPPSRKTSANHSQKAARPALARNASSNSTGFGTTTSIAGPRTSTTTQPATPAPHEGTYARIQRAAASFFGSVLGKRKAAAMEADREKTQHQQLLDERKKAAEAAYHEAKDRGLLPTPKVFVRPSMRSASHGTPAPPLDKLRLTAAIADAATPNRTPHTPRTPGTLHHTPSKKDLHKQKKLSKRVSALELKLASARKELQTVLHSDLPPVPVLPSLQRADQQEPTPEISQSENEVEVESPPISCTPRSIGKIVKKRKAATHDEDAEYKPLPTDADGDIDLLSAHSASERENEMPTPERMIKRVKSSASKKNLKKQGTRLQKRLSRGSLRERNGSKESDVEMRVVPDGDRVPDVPVIPREMESMGRRSRVVREGDDGFGGLGHEIF